MTTRAKDSSGFLRLLLYLFYAARVCPSNVMGSLVSMRTRDRKATRNKEKAPRSVNSGPIAFFVSLFIVAVGVIQLVSTLNVYAADLSHLNSLRRQEAALIAQKQELENDISRWDDKSYVAAQARDRLGFVFPGEQSVHVLNPQAVTGESADQQESGSGSSTQSKQLPWYSELSYSFKEADQEDSLQSDSSDSVGQQQSDSAGQQTDSDGQQTESGEQQQSDTQDGSQEENSQEESTQEETNQENEQ